MKRKKKIIIAPVAPTPVRIENSIAISFTSDLNPSQRLDLIAKINDLIEGATGATLVNGDRYHLDYQSKSTLITCSGSTSFGRCSG